MMSSLTIGEVARQVGLMLSALRYCEKAGLVPPPRSSKCRYYIRRVIGRIRISLLARDGARWPSGRTVQHVESSI